MTNALETEVVYLPLRFGEITLGTSRLHMSVDKTHFLDNRQPRVPPVSEIAGDGHLIRSCPVEAPLPRLSLVEGYLRYVPRQYRRHYINLSMGWEAYQAHFSSKSRQTLRRKLRRFAKESGGEIDWRIYSRPEELDSFHRIAREVSKVTYQERLLDAGLPDSLKFVEHARELATADALRAYLLFLHGKPVAYLYCPIQNGVLIYQYLGYTPDVAPLSPGTVLQWLALESIFSEGRFRIFDFSEGDGYHKEYFGTENRICADLYFFKRKTKPISVAFTQTIIIGVSNSISWTLEKLGIKLYIKRLIRTS